MKKLTGIFFILAWVTFAAAADIPRGWSDDPKAAWENAKRSEKDLLILFTGTKWNNMCRIFDREVVDNKYFKELTAENFVAVYLNFAATDKTDSRKAYIREKFKDSCGLTVYPTILIVAPDGKKRALISGYHPGREEDYLLELAKYCKNKPDKFVRKFEKRRNK